MNWNRTLAGAGIAAVAGCAAWVGVAWATGYELGVLAIVVGLAVGIGTAMGAQGRAGTAGGVAAGAVTVLAIVAARGIIVQMTVKQVLREAMAEGVSEIPGAEDDEFWTAFIADQFIEQEIEAGGSVDWMDPEDAGDSISGMYPEHIWARATANWARLSAREREQFCKLATKKIISDGERGMGDAELAFGIIGNVVSNFHPMALVMMGIAVATAFKTARDGRPTQEAIEGETTTVTPPPPGAATTMTGAMGGVAVGMEGSAGGAGGGVVKKPVRPVKPKKTKADEEEDAAAMAQLPPWLRPPKE